MGNVWSPVHWPHTTRNPSVRRIAHAIAIDERRAFFRQNRWSPSARQVVSEVWFPGVHSDIGGGYPASSGRLWAITLRWMTGHARDAGLRFNEPRLETLLNEGAQHSAGTPDAATDQHDSLTWGWKPLELVPKPWKPRRHDGTYGATRLLVPALRAGFAGRPRTLHRGEHVHRSAIERFVARSDYRPKTLTSAGLDLDEARRFLTTSEECWVVPAPV
jgi:uncharacterized protein (DUF2235 family)